jgi:hypothetical protein
MTLGDGTGGALQYLLFFVELVFESGLHTCKAGALLLELNLQYILLWLFWRWGLEN